MGERLMRVKVEAGARADSIVEYEKGGFALTAREPASDNRSNLRVREMIAERLQLPLARVRIVSGHHRPRKTIQIVT